MKNIISYKEVKLNDDLILGVKYTRYNEAFTQDNSIVDDTETIIDSIDFVRGNHNDLFAWANLETTFELDKSRTYAKKGLLYSGKDLYEKILEKLC